MRAPFNMPWHPLPRIAFAVATFPFQATHDADLPLELGDELYIIEEGGRDGSWFRGYLIAPPSLLAGLTSSKGQTLEARVFSGIFPRSCVEVREVLHETDESTDEDVPYLNGFTNGLLTPQGSPGSPNSIGKKHKKIVGGGKKPKSQRRSKSRLSGNSSPLSIPAQRDPTIPKPQAPVPMLKIGDETPTSLSEPLVDEIASCLREWHSTNLHELLLTRQYGVLDELSALIKRLELSRRQFLHNVLTSHELELLRERTVWDLVRGNKLLKGEIVVRDPLARGRLLTGDDSAVDLTALQSMMSLLDERPQPAVENLALHHLLVDVRALVGASTESSALVLYLASKQPGSAIKALSESYVVEVPPSGALTSLAKLGNLKMKTLFTDLASGDIGEAPAAETELYLVVKLQQVQQPVVAKVPASRSGTAPKEHTNSSTARDISGSDLGIKPTRRSLMWGKATQRGHSRTRTASKLQSFDEEPASRGSEEGPPATAGSRGPTEVLRTGNFRSQVSRTVGVGALKLNNIMKRDSEVEQVMDIWVPSTAHPDSSSQEKGEGWVDVIKELMNSATGRFEKSRKSERLQLQLHPFISSDAESLIRATPTLLADTTQTPKMGFSGAPTKPRSDVYVTLSEAFLPRHALLSRPVGSATPVSSTLGGSNLQISMEVRRASGERIEAAIIPSSNGEAVSVWDSSAAERGEAWNQTIRLAISPDDVQGSHLVMRLADAPNRAFAMSFMPLWDQQAFMRDGHHSLQLYKYDEATSTARPDATGKGGYLSLRWNARGKDDVSRDEAVTGPMATLRIETFLCSTQFSQDKVLLGLIRWKERRPGELPELLKQLVFVPEIEIVKLLNEVFDSLFGILVENAGNDDCEDLVFSSLVTVLGIVHDRRFNLGPLVDHYAEHKFNYPFATPCLVRSFTRLLANPADSDSSRRLRATFKVVRHILKFITHARGQQKEKERDIGITSTSPGFSRLLRSIFKALDGLMRNTAPILVGSQTLAVQHFHTWLPELTGLLSAEEILHIAIDFMDSCALVKGKLVLYKLVLIINYSRLELFSHAEQRTALAANTARWISPHWGKTSAVTDQWREQVRLCCSVLASQMDVLGPDVPDHVPKIIACYLTLQAIPKKPKTHLSMLFPTTYPFPSKAITEEDTFDETMIELSTILSALSTRPGGMQLELGDDDLGAILDDLLHVHLSILRCEAFPSSWLSVHIYHHKSTMQTLKYVAGIMLESFLPNPDDDSMSYNTELWRIFFTVLLKLVGSDALALETFPEQKRRAVWKIAGDVREDGAELLRTTWEAIGWDTDSEDKKRYGLSRMGGYQVQYVPSLVGPIVELCLSVHEGLRRVAVEVLQTMVASEWNMSEDLTVIQTEMIDCLDVLFTTKTVTESTSQKLFINELVALFEPLSKIPDDPLCAALKDMIGTIDDFLDLLVAVHSTDLTGQASHMMHRLRLMDFLRDMQKEEIFIRYVHQLATLQADSRNWTEAGLALRLHADLYEWDPSRHLPALTEPEFPAQSGFDRKERIFFEMIKHFEEGEAWSSALQAYKQLQYQYEENVFDFAKLARTQRAIASIYETISNNNMVAPKYFRVKYRGMGFPPSLREKDYIFEGLPGERTSAFTDRMQEQHPAAQIVGSGDVDDVEGQFLQISSLSPHRDLEHPVLQRSKVPQHVRDYLLSAHPQRFSTTVRRNISGPVNEHWADKMLYGTQDVFPTILQRSEIISAERVRLSPLQTAIERVIRKTHDMIALEQKINDGDQDQVPLLIEALTISVNAASDSSIIRYRDLLPANAAPNDSDVEAEGSVDFEDAPEIQLSSLENALKMALVDHAIMIKRCLAMFVRSSNAQLRASYDDLSQDFEEAYRPELESLAGPKPQETAQAWSVPPSRAPTSVDLRPMPRISTNATLATTATSVLNTPTHRPQPSPRMGGRLSFFGGKSKHDANGGASAPTFKPLMSGGVTRKPLPTLELPESKQGDSSGGIEDAHSRSSSHSHGKDNSNKRRSFFGGPGSREASSRLSVELGGGDPDWFTEMGQDSMVGGRGRGRTSTSDSTGDAPRGSSDGGSGSASRVGSVRKRLSMLKLGKKSSKASGIVNSVAEED